MGTSAAKFSKMEASSFRPQIIQRCMQMHHLPRPKNPVPKSSNQKRQSMGDNLLALYTMAMDPDAWFGLPLNVLLARLDAPDSNVRTMALATLCVHGKLTPAMLAQHAYVVIAMLGDSSEFVREMALHTLGKLEPVTLAQHANAVVAMLADSEWQVRHAALVTLCQLEPVTLAQYADPVVARLEDANSGVRRSALKTLRKLEPATLARHANALITKILITKLHDSSKYIRTFALATLCKVEPVMLAQHAKALITKLEDSSEHVRNAALTTLAALPLAVTRDIDLKSSEVRSRLLGRLAWYNYRLHARVKRIALYWYVLPYRPSGPGYTREVEAWRRMQELRLS